MSMIRESDLVLESNADSKPCIYCGKVIHSEFSIVRTGDEVICLDCFYGRV